MILTPQERRALLTLVVLLALGQAVSLWQERRRSRPDRELSAWLSRLESARADTAAGPPGATASPPGDPAGFPRAFATDLITAEPASDSLWLVEGPPPVPVEPADSAPPGVLETGRLQVNRASARDLEALPGIGPTMARRIVEERARGGPFLRPDDLLRVKGIGPKTLQRIQDRVDCAPPRVRGARRPSSRRRAARRRAASAEMVA